MIYPKFIREGDTIGITAPSMGITNEYDIKRLENAYKNFEQLGYKCIETKNVRTNEKFISSSASERAKEFEQLWNTDDVSLIISASGGEFLMEMLSYLNEDVIRNGVSKWVQGYSDVSLILYYLTTKFNIATLHSVNAKSFGMATLYASLNKTLDFLKGERDTIQNSFELYEKERFSDDKCFAGYNLTEKVEYKHLCKKQNDIIEGRIIGGCIDVISILLGTEFDNTQNFINQFDEGMLWYLDNCELPLTSLYRTLWQMKESGWFNNANGILLGRTAVEKKIWDFSYEDALHKVFDDLKIPIIYDTDIGHLPPQWFMINGSIGKFIYQDGTGSLTQKF